MANKKLYQKLKAEYDSSIEDMKKKDRINKESR